MYHPVCVPKLLKRFLTGRAHPCLIVFPDFTAVMLKTISNMPTVPWHWDSGVRIALAPGIGCFEALFPAVGEEPDELILGLDHPRAGSGQQSSPRPNHR
jgi:hypothetical protein